jgi:hypothetical protein
VGSWRPPIINWSGFLRRFSSGQIGSHLTARLPCSPKARNISARRASQKANGWRFRRFLPVIRPRGIESECKCLKTSEGAENDSFAKSPDLLRRISPVAQRVGRYRCGGSSHASTWSWKSHVRARFPPALQAPRGRARFSSKMSPARSDSWQPHSFRRLLKGPLGGFEVLEI